MRGLRFATFLAPNMYKVYQYIVRTIGRQLGLETELYVGSVYEELAGPVDGAFLCGLPYVELQRRSEPPVELLAAPVLQGSRYASQPIYFSDVIVHRDSPFQTFADLRGHAWSYNEPNSHSGHGLVRYHLARLGQTLHGYFGKVIEAGFHEQSLRLVAGGEVAASAIDSQVLAVAMRDEPALAASLRVIDVLGPSTIQPVVASRRLPAALKAELRQVLVELARDAEGVRQLAHGFIDRFVPIEDCAYDDIRRMQEIARQAESGRGTHETPPAEPILVANLAD